jgi:hypothetical protein
MAATPPHPTAVDGNLQAAELAVKAARGVVENAKKELEAACAKHEAAKSPEDKEIASMLIHAQKQIFDYEMSKLRIAMENWDMARRIAYPSTPGHDVSPFDSDSFEHMLQNAPTISHQRGAIQDALNSLDPLLLNPWSQDTPEFQATMGVARKNEIRKKSAKHYNRYRKRGNLARCSVTGIWGDCNTVVGAQLLPVGTTTTNVQIALNIVGKLNDPRNVIPLLKTIEKAYDKQRLCIVLHDPDGGGNEVTLRIFDPALKDETVDGTMTFGDLAGIPFDLPEGGENNEGPFKRCLSFHAQTGYAEALQRGWHLVKEGWNGVGPKPTEYGSPLDTNKITFLKTATSAFDETSVGSGISART